MLVLFETAAGFALFKVLKEKKIRKVDDLSTEFETLDKASKLIKLKAFEKFNDSKSALKAVSSLLNNKLSSSLKKFLKKNIVSKGIEDELVVQDKKMQRVIEEKLGIKCAQGSQYMELIRGIRSQIEGLISGFTESEQRAMSLGLAHSMCRYRLKFSVDKIDTMIVQAVNLLDDIDKELNNYAMRLREWYSWHFPELMRIITDNLVYAKAVKLMRSREKCRKTDLSEVVPEEIETEIKEAAELSMGTEITNEDMDHIVNLCDQVISLSEYRVSLAEYLRNRMQAIAPNLTVLVGELVGARLIAHAGSLINLSKHPASTIQILGAEKALFRAIRTKHDTPKYGLLYHASIVGSVTPNIKGKISRSLAAKCALCIRVDALGEQTEATVGVEHKQALENRVKYLETHVTPSALSGRRPQAYSRPAVNTMYNVGGDVTTRVELPSKRNLDDEDKPRKRRE